MGIICLFGADCAVFASPQRAERREAYRIHAIDESKARSHACRMQIVARSVVPKVVLLVAATVLILALRRPDQFLDPAIWVEEGSFILAGYVNRGFASIMEPINGYHVLSSRLLGLVAFKTSFAWAPEIAAVLAAVFICAVIVAIAISPTFLPWPFLCALAVLLVPSDPEVFGVALYSFWWAGLLLPVALLWSTTTGVQWWRLAFIVVGGLSSPLIIPFAGLMALRAVFERTRNEMVAAGLAAAIAALQFTTFMGSGQYGLTQSIGLTDFVFGVNQFLGIFTSGPRRWFSEESPGFIVLAVLVLLVWFARKKLNWYFVLLILAWCAVSAATVLRAPVQYISPAGSGPRYFFYPLVLALWIFVWIAAKSAIPPRLLLATGFVLAITFIGPKLARRHELLDWRRHVEACARSERYDLPVLVESKASDVWRVALTGEQCRRVIAQSLTGT